MLDINPHAYGVVYMITNHINSKYYIGKKCLHKGKKWEKYWGSCKELTDDIKREGIDNFSKEILINCFSSYELSYYEIDKMVRYNWLSDKCYNQNMSGRYFKSKLNTHINENRASYIPNNGN